MFELLGFGDKSERAQKVFALDYCSGAFVTEGVFFSPHSDVYYSPFAARVGGDLDLPPAAADEEASAGGRSEEVKLGVQSQLDERDGLCRMQKSCSVENRRLAIIVSFA